jgi:predicted Zn-dependent protease
MQRICFVLLAAAVVATAQPQPTDRGINFYSKEREVALGAVLAKDLLNRATKFENDEVLAYVDGLVQRLAQQLPPDGFTFTIKLVGDEDRGTHEPLAVPGGYLFVQTLLILDARSEDELAGMLAHAMAHIAARHGTRQATRIQVANQGTIPLIYMGGWTGYGARQASEVLIPMNMRSLARGFELEADRIAVQLMADAGYDPRALAAFIDRTQPVPRSPSLSALPTKEQRAVELSKTIEALPARAYTSHDGLAKIQATLRASLP